MIATCPLGSVVAVSAGQPAPKADEFSDEGIPFIRAGSLENLLNGGTLADCEKIPETTARKNRLRLYPKDTVVFAKSGMSATLGRVYRLPEPAYVVSHLAALVPTGEYDPRFLTYWLRRNPPSHLIKDSAYPSIRTSEIEEVQVPNPPLPEQERIASILDKADDIRRKRERAVAMTGEFLNSAFLEIFGDPLQNNKQWRIAKLGDVGTLDRGKSMHRPRNDPRLLNGPYPLIQTGDVARSKRFIREFKSTYSEFGLAQSKLWPAGTLCITIAANIADTAILTFDACFPDSVVGFVPSNQVTLAYIQQWFGFLKPIIERKAPKVAQSNINLSILRSTEVPIPPIELQKKFQRITDTVWRAYEKYEEELQEARWLIGSLSQRAFRGEL